LGEKLLALGRTADAIDDYEKLLAEAPNYAGKAEIEEKLTVLKGNDSGTNTAAKL
jgi:hypothetical protein